MTGPDWGTLLARFFADDRLRIILLLIVLDLGLGVAVAVRHGTFRLAYITAFLRDDVLGKVVPWFVVYGASIVVHGNVIIPGLDLDLVQNGIWVLILGAMTGSILSSLADFGLLSRASKLVRAIASPEVTVHPPSPAPPSS